MSKTVSKHKVKNLDKTNLTTDFIYENEIGKVQEDPAKTNFTSSQAFSSRDMNRITRSVMAIARVLTHLFETKDNINCTLKGQKSFQDKIGVEGVFRANTLQTGVQQSSFSGQIHNRQTNASYASGICSEYGGKRVYLATHSSSPGLYYTNNYLPLIQKNSSTVETVETVEVGTSDLDLHLVGNSIDFTKSTSTTTSLSINGNLEFSTIGGKTPLTDTTPDMNCGYMWRLKLTFKKGLVVGFGNWS